MTALRFTIRPKAPFGSPLLGETLFGQLCWAILRLYGKERLEALLDGYCEGRPFAVVADAFPKGCIPLPALPAQFWAQHDDSPQVSEEEGLDAARSALRTPEPMA